MLQTFAIPLTFIIISSMALWIIIGCKGWWWLKALTVVVALWFSAFLWGSLNTIKGWATTDPVPDKYELKWVVIKEPNKKTEHPGAIYLWMIDLNAKDKDKGTPRVYEVPYSKELHQQAVNAMGKIGKGGKFFGSKNGKGIGKGDGEGEGSGGKGLGRKGKGKGQKGAGGGMSENTDAFRLYELPPPSYPQKFLEN